jgi:uncharacterized membrane protein
MKPDKLTWHEFCREALCLQTERKNYLMRLTPTTALGLSFLTALGLNMARPAQASPTSYIYTTVNGPGPSNSTSINSINNNGQIVGEYRDSGDNIHIFVATLGMDFTTITVPGGTLISPNSINDNGEIVGTYHSIADSAFASFIKSPGVEAAPLNLPDAVGNIYALGINNSGQIVGRNQQVNGNYGFVYSPSTGLTLLDYPGSVFGTSIDSINNKGQYVGYYRDSFNVYHSFLNTPGTGFSSLDVPGATAGTVPLSINDNGQVVEHTYYNNSPGDGQNYVYTPGNGFALINDPLATGFTFARGINNAGQIVGEYQDVSGSHGFVATPVPEASLSLTMGLGLSVVGLTLLRARRQVKSDAYIADSAPSAGMPK